MNVPDYVVPIVGYRVWQWDGSKLKSLNGESWYPRRPLTARCRLNCHQPPHPNCSCGIYAHKLDFASRMPNLPWMPTLPRMGALRRMPVFRMLATPKMRFPDHVAGEVYLWGTVVEHALGWRAQVAYPKSLVVPFAMIPTGAKQAQSWLQAFVAYGVDIFIDEGKCHIPVWTKKAGYNSAGLDYLRKAATGEGEAASIPIAILTEDSHRHVLLQNGMEVKHTSKIVFTDVQVTPKALDRIINQRAMVVVIDLTPENLRYAYEAISFIRKARHDIAVFVRLDPQDPLSAIAGTFIKADACLHKNFRDDVQVAYEEFLKRHIKGRRDGTGWKKPPGGPPSPPAVPVHSLVDIIRIIHSRRERWAAQWTLRTDR
jgi:hypothetical protein